MKKGDTPQPIEIIAQCTGMKNLKIEGGWRLQFDLFESRERDAMMVMGLVNRRQPVKITIESMEGKKHG